MKKTNLQKSLDLIGSTYNSIKKGQYNIIEIINGPNLLYRLRSNQMVVDLESKNGLSEKVVSDFLKEKFPEYSFKKMVEYKRGRYMVWLYEGKERFSSIFQ